MEPEPVCSRVRGCAMAGLRAGVLMGLPVFAAQAVLNVNRLSGFWDSYDPATSSSDFVVLRSFHWFVVEPLIYYLIAVVLTSAAEIMSRVAFPNHPSPAAWFGIEDKNRKLPGSVRRKVWGKALLIACGISLVLLAIDTVVDVHRDANAAKPVNMTSLLPVADGLAIALRDGLPPAMALLFVGAFIYRNLRRWWLLALLIAGAAVCWHGGSAAGTVAAVGVVAGLAAAGYSLARWLYRDNFPAYILTVVLGKLLSESKAFLFVSDAYVWWNGMALLGVFSGALLLGVWLCATTRQSDGAEGA